MTYRVLFAILCVFALGFVMRRSVGAQAPEPRPASFARTAEVMTLLEMRCVQCHDKGKRKGELELTTRERILKGGESGPAVVPGSPEKSLLYKLVTHSAEPAMPSNGAKLSEPQLALLAEWIKAGVPYDRALGKGASDAAWWSLQPLRTPALPNVDAPEEWNANPIDRFVLAKLKEQGLKPSAPADRRTLLRRASFDLIGLPPTPEEIDAFVNDPAPDAYEKIVERLLNSPRHGERWARHWMDVVHFAETHGHDQDVPREHAWPYRDYLIQSFNSDKPYARFIEEQIAGDVLYPKDPQATVALGFLAAGPWDESSLKDIREDTLDRKAGQYLDRDDMVGTVALTLLSTTAQCARCHDHKFDPISQKEYFGLQAVFAGVDRANRPYDFDPTLRARRVALEKRKQELVAKPATEALLKVPAVVAEVAAWEQSIKDVDAWRVVDPLVVSSTHGSTFAKQPDLSLLATGKTPEKDTYTIEAISMGSTLTAIRLQVLDDPSLPQQGPGRQANGNLHLSEFKVEVAPLSDLKQRRAVSIARAFADFNQDGWSIEHAIDGNPGTAWGIHPRVRESHVAVFVLKEPLAAKDNVRLFFTLEQLHGGGHLIGRPRLSLTAAPPPASIRPVPPAIQRILATPAGQREGKERLELAQFALLHKIDAELAALPAPKLVYAAANDFVPQGSFRPAKGCRPVHVLRRGDIKQPLELAAPGALACVPGLNAKLPVADPTDESQRRAALAKWISDPKNALTWRSIVNRVWHHHFGRGIVATPSDFGRMGAKPSHPELLDWLTSTFLADGGSLKKLHRRIVTSAAYRQSSRHDAEAAKRDVDNVWLWRMNVTRLDAESVRDAVLAVSGKLDLAMGGPSVKHFVQSPGIHRTPKADYLAFDPDAPGAHRRSIYRFIFRTVPDPFMDALDCPDASQFTAVRPVSVTALQALALLNDAFMVRSSEHFASRVAGAGETKMQVRLAFRLALGRNPRAEEEPAFVQYAERHGMANACRVLFNCNEFVFAE